MATTCPPENEADVRHAAISDHMIRESFLSSQWKHLDKVASTPPNPKPEIKTQPVFSIADGETRKYISGFLQFLIKIYLPENKQILTSKQ